MSPRSNSMVVSASRRVEMVGYFPERLADFLERRCPPERVHTVVLWSKDPRNLLRQGPLKTCLEKYGQCFLHLTVTGMGGTCFEPGIPPMTEILDLLPDLVHWLKDPQRIRLRFDPIVRFRFPDGHIYTNLENFPCAAESAKQAGVDRMVLSWITLYPKVIHRLKRHGIEALDISGSERAEEKQRIDRWAGEAGVEWVGCCVPGLPVSHCINGRILNTLHQGDVPASERPASGQRPCCGCTMSWDIGWYYPCPGGCLYCYGRPKESQDSSKGFPAERSAIENLSSK